MQGDPLLRAFAAKAGSLAGEMWRRILLENGGPMLAPGALHLGRIRARRYDISEKHGKKGGKRPPLKEAPSGEKGAEQQRVLSTDRIAYASMEIRDFGAEIPNLHTRICFTVG